METACRERVVSAWRTYAEQAVRATSLAGWSACCRRPTLLGRHTNNVLLRDAVISKGTSRGHLATAVRRRREGSERALFASGASAGVAYRSRAQGGKHAARDEVAS